jgi:glucosyl-3-phosphoglycerate synthase
VGDFHQTGVVATFHRLGKGEIDKIERELVRYSKYRPIALVLPSLYSELQGEALRNILKELKDIKYISQIIVSLGSASYENFKHAKEFFSILPQDVKIIWNDGEKIQSVYKLLENEGIGAGEDGKGRSTWMAYGYILAKGKAHVIVLHDCDILTYNRDMLARLCYPIVSPNLNYEFCKGYYSRVTDRMHGRVTRLFVTPLIRTLVKLLGHIPILLFWDSFRYPLAGEFSMITHLARVNMIPGDWGLEMGVLAEVFRNCTVERVCQVDISENYEHKHQPLSADDPNKGLLKMAIDIAKSMFRTLASEGIAFSEGFFKTLMITYLRTAQDTIKRYEDDAEINGLFFDRHEEVMAVEAFSNAIRIASENIMEDPLRGALIPSWHRVTSAIPNILNIVENSVDEDNK